MHMEDLTDTERQLILELREKEASKRTTAEQRIKVLRLAYEYEQFLDQEGCGSALSTFIDEFGYTDGDAMRMYELVQHVRHMVPGEPYNG